MVQPLWIFLLFNIVIVTPIDVAKEDEKNIAGRILKEAIFMSEHFMDNPSIKNGVGSDIKKTNIMYKHAQTFERDVGGDKRMLSHEVRVVQGRCDINKQCPDSQYCDGMFCFIFKKEGDNCDLNGECEKGSECQFGLCTKGIKMGDPGTFCDLARDCKGENQCCIRELSISKHTSICKPMLKEHESCGPINLFHQAEQKAHVEPLCGPCEKGLACKGIGIFGRHSVCLPNDEE